MTIDIPVSTFPERDKLLADMAEILSPPSDSYSHPTNVLVTEITDQMFCSEIESLRDNQNRISTDLFRIESKLDKLFEITLILGEIVKK